MRSLTLIIAAAAVSFFTVQNSQSADKAVTGFPAEVSWGRIVARESALELHVKKIPANRVIAFPRLNNRMKSVYLQGKTEEQSKLKFKPEINTWEITLPDNLPTDATPVVIFETLEPIELATKPHVVQQSRDGGVTLPAHHVITHGKLLRYEPQPHKNTMGYWANAEDWAEWHVEISQPTEFEVEVLQGCGKGQGGSTVEIEIAGSKVQFEIEDTGHFQNFKPRKIGNVRVAKAGDFALKIRAVRKAKNAVCDIRQIRLLPVKK
ncbi:MAG: hypothetical protein HQ518_04600 [Rhodopirellula sp.]|nr:hypothetical protein [Rhodopirellula sp.]